MVTINLSPSYMQQVVNTSFEKHMEVGIKVKMISTIMGL